MMEGKKVEWERRKSKGGKGKGWEREKGEGVEKHVMEISNRGILFNVQIRKIFF
jgi:hypothetical protein